MAGAVQQTRTVGHIPEVVEETVHILTRSQEDCEREDTDDEVVAAHGSVTGSFVESQLSTASSDYGGGRWFDAGGVRCFAERFALRWLQP